MRAGPAKEAPPKDLSPAPSAGRWTTLRRPRYNHRATAPQPAYRRWGPGHSPGGGRAAVRLSSRPLPVRAGHRSSVASAGQPRLPPKHLPLHAQRPMSRVAIPTPLPLLAAPEPHPCVSRACAFWQVGHFFARSGAEDHPPNRLCLAADPQRARRRLPLDHIHSPPLSNLPQPPIHPSTPPPTLQSTPPQHLSRIPPPTAHPPCARSCKFYLVW